MMNVMRIFSINALVLISSLAFAIDKIDTKYFIEEVSAMSIAEIEIAKLALTKSPSIDVRRYAQKMLSGHSTTNKGLAVIVSRKNIEVSDEIALSAKAKKFMLEQGDDESFDEAYADNEVSAHEASIELFERAAISDDVELAAFARNTLPRLKQHLKLAKELVVAHDDE